MHCMRILSDLLGSIYIAFCFLRQLHVGDKEQTIVFSRGAFRRDIHTFGKGTGLVEINVEWLKRFLRFGVPNGWFEQVICLRYRLQLRDAYPLTIRTLRYFAAQHSKRIVYGGVDYYEVAMFADHSFYSSGTRIDAVFHENYAIDYVKNLNYFLYRGVKERFLFDDLYTYGAPASQVLVGYTRNPLGSLQMVMPRLSSMEDDVQFFERLNDIDTDSFANTILLLAFPGTEYLAPLCFTSTLLELARMGAEENCHPIVKFKNKTSARMSIRHAGHLKHHIRWVFEGSIENLVWQAGFTIVFNSISLYEALLGPTVIIIPAYLDAQHDQNILQESKQTIDSLGQKMQSVLFANSQTELSEIMSLMDGKMIKEIVRRERDLRKALVARKFHLVESLSC